MQCFGHDMRSRRQVRWRRRVQILPQRRSVLQRPQQPVRHKQDLPEPHMHDGNHYDLPGPDPEVPQRRRVRSGHGELQLRIGGRQHYMRRQRFLH